MVEGVIDLRGDIIPIIDLGKLFRTTRLKASADAKILIMEVNGQQAGFVVDEVTEVHAVQPEKVSPPSPVLLSGRSQAASMVSGIINMGENRLVVLVDAGRILASTDLSVLPS